jgi:hypothetical protein
MKKAYWDNLAYLKEKVTPTLPRRACRATHQLQGSAGHARNSHGGGQCTH